MMCEAELWDNVCMIISQTLAHCRPPPRLVLKLIEYSIRTPPSEIRVSVLPQHFPIQTAVVQLEVSLPRPRDEAPQRASGPNRPPGYHHQPLTDTTALPET